MRPVVRRIPAAVFVLFVAGLVLTPPVWAAPIVWFVEPGSGDVVRMDPRTGAELGRFAPPLVPSLIDRNLGLSIADGGQTLLYQLANRGPFTFTDPRRFQLYGLDPYTGAVQSIRAGLGTSFGPDGLSWEQRGGHTYTFFSHANPGADIHRVEDLGLSDESELLFFGPTEIRSVHSVGGLGGDGNGREFGGFRDAANPGLGLVIDEYDPFTGATLRSFTAPEPDVEGLAFDGLHLYASTASGLLFTLDPATGGVLHTVVMPDWAPSRAGLYTYDIAAVPEPGVLPLLLVGAVALRRRIGHR